MHREHLVNEETIIAVFITIALIIAIVFGFKDMINKTYVEHNSSYESFRW